MDAETVLCAFLECTVRVVHTLAWVVERAVPLHRRLQGAARSRSSLVERTFDGESHDEAASMQVVLDGGATCVQPMIQSGSPVDTAFVVYSAMSYQVGIMHGDFRSENVLPASDGTLKIGDFGLSPDVPRTTAHWLALFSSWHRRSWRMDVESLREIFEGRCVQRYVYMYGKIPCAGPLSCTKGQSSERKAARPRKRLKKTHEVSRTGNRASPHDRGLIVRFDRHAMGQATILPRVTPSQLSGLGGISVLSCQSSQRSARYRHR